MGNCRQEWCSALAVEGRDLCAVHLVNPSLRPMELTPEDREAAAEGFKVCPECDGDRTCNECDGEDECPHCGRECGFCDGGKCPGCDGLGKVKKDTASTPITDGELFPNG